MEERCVFQRKYSTKSFIPKDVRRQGGERGGGGGCEKLPVLYRGRYANITLSMLREL